MNFNIVTIFKNSQRYKELKKLLLEVYPASDSIHIMDVIARHEYVKTLMNMGEYSDVFPPIAKFSKKYVDYYNEIRYISPIELKQDLTKILSEMNIQIPANDTLNSKSGKNLRLILWIGLFSFSVLVFLISLVVIYATADTMLFYDCSNHTGWGRCYPGIAVIPFWLIFLGVSIVGSAYKIKETWRKKIVKKSSI